MKSLPRLLLAGLLALLCAACACVAESASGANPQDATYIYDLELTERSFSASVEAPPGTDYIFDLAVTEQSVEGSLDDPAELARRERLSAMSLDEKVRQMLLVSCHSADSALRAARFGAGGVCLYANYFSGKSRAQVRSDIAGLQAAAGLPLLVAVDEEGGGVCRVSANPRLRESAFRSPRGLYAEGGWALVESDAREKSQFLLDLGINLNLAPVCDVPSGSSDYIYARSFGTDASLTAEFAARTVAVMREEGIGSALKHFPGYGSSSDTHAGIAYDDRSYAAFERADFLPFAAGIEAGAPSVMVSHNIVRCMDPKNPASLSPKVHQILRRELGFEGVILTDDLYMGAIRQYLGGANAAVLAVQAGNDLLCCADYEASAAAIVQAVESGEIPVEQIDASVLRILQWKQELGLI